MLKYPHVYQMVNGNSPAGNDNQTFNTHYEPRKPQKTAKYYSLLTLKLPLIMQNKPNLPKCQNKHKPSPNNGLRKSPASQPPKQTQFTECQNKRNLSPDKGLRKQTTLYEKRNTNYAKQTQFPERQNKRNLILGNGLRKSQAFRIQAKQTQSNPICSELAEPVSNLFRFLSTAFYESGEGNSWQFKVIMVQILTLKGLNYVL